MENVGLGTFGKSHPIMKAPCERLEYLELLSRPLRFEYVLHLLQQASYYKLPHREGFDIQSSIWQERNPVSRRLENPILRFRPS